MPFTTPKHIGDRNKNAIISILREKGRASRVELSRLMGVSQPTVTRNISKLLEGGIILEHGADESSLGRKPVLIEICRDYCYVVGADVVSGSIKVAVANLMGEMVSFRETPLIADKTVFDQLIALMDAVLADPGVHPARIRQIVLGTSGIFDPTAGRSIFTIFTDGWEDIDVRRALATRYGIDTFVDNDVNLDLIGEHWKGAGRNYDSILYIKLGQGVASRIALQGKLLRGQYNAAGEIGFMLPGSASPLNYEHLMCDAALVAQYQSLSGKGEFGPTSLKDLLILRKGGDPVARRVVSEMLDRLWVLTLNCIAALDPEVVIYGGDGCYLEPSDIATLRSRIEQQQSLPRTLLTSHLDRKACIYGAISTALAIVEDQIIATL